MPDISHKLEDVSQEEFQIVPGSIDKLPAVMDIMGSSFDDAFGESWNEHQCRSMLSLPGTRLLMARFNDRLCGFSINRAVVDEEELLMIAVHPDFQHKGIGRKLMERLIHDAQARGAKAIFLEVRSDNSAQALYCRMGFEQIGLRPCYYTGIGDKKFDAKTYKMRV